LDILKKAGDSLMKIDSVRGKKIIIFSIVIISFFFTFQKLSKNEINQRKKELENIKKEIDDFENKLRESEIKEKSTLELIDKYDKKGSLINKLIGKLGDEIDYQEGRVREIESDIAHAEERLVLLKKDYAKYVVSTYKKGRIRDFELILSANSLNQMYIRIEYLKRFSNHRKNELSKIIAQKDTIDRIAARLRDRIDDKKSLLSERTGEEAKLKKLVNTRKDALDVIKKDKESFKRELDRRTRAAKDIERIINKLIAEEIKKKEKEDDTEPTPKNVKLAFGMKKGKLMWPVSGGKILNHFGNQVHPTLKTVTQNIGIDISVPEGTNVKSVANGEVVDVNFMPGYGNLIIISHHDGYLTVYAHISQILIKEGQNVKEGQVIGRSGESLYGPMLHFQIWKNRDKLNPELWLSGR
jgi:murein hydrolase activator